MNHDEEKWQEKVQPLKPVSRCPKCGSLSLSYARGKLKCGECGFEQDIPRLK